MENHLSSLFFYYLLVPLLWLLLTGCKSVSTGTGTISGSGSDTSQRNTNNGNHNGTTTTLNKLLLKKLSTNSEFDSILEELLFPGESNSMANCDHHTAINLTGRYGFVKSPQFPSGYRVPLFCRWNIVATRPNEIITISFEEIDIEIPNESQAECRRTSKPKYCCDRNYLSISAKDSVEEQLYCGVTAPSRQVFISSSSRVSIAFNATTNRKDSRGFYFTYSIASRSSMDCASNEFHCNNGKCIPPKWLCNNRDECGDSSDETLCNSSQDNLQKCNNDESEFYHSSKRCDSRFDCRNRADELGCFGCPANKFMCRSTQTCIEASSVCNGIADCEDFDDELNCGFCPPGKVRCGSMSACYDPFRQRCNRVLDCPNGIDEVNCFDECRGRISCGNASGCYEMDERCNGIVQCADFSDEKNCSLELCRPDKGSFLCSNGRCIPSLWTCDRSADCFDGSDEMRCLKNSVITAAIIGSLICGLLIVIAVSCACKLVALRKMEQYRRSLNSSAFPGGGGAGGAAGGGGGLSLHSAEFPFSSNPGDMDASLFRLDHSVFFREPPPSYATTMGGYQDVNGAHNSSTNSYMEQYRRYRRQRRCRRMMRRQHRQNQNTLQLSNNNNNNNNSGSEAEGSSLQACLPPDSQDYHHSHSTNTNPGTIQPPCNRSPLSSVQPTSSPPATATSTSSPAAFSGQVTLPNQYNSSPFTSHSSNNNSSSHSHTNSHPTHQNSKFTNLGSPVAGCSSTDTTSTTTTNSSDSIVQPPPPPPLTKPNSSSIPNLSINGGSSSSVRSAPSPLQSTYHQLQHLHYLPNPNKLQQPSQAQQTQQQHNGVDNNRRHLTIELEPIPALTNFDCDSQPLIR